MCGIVGVFCYDDKGLSMYHESIFRQMLYADALRGMHGTGIFAVDDEGSSARIRVGGPPSQLFDAKAYRTIQNFFGTKWVRFMVGHNRYATKGKHITEHTHPFRDQHITLVHNGTLDFYSHLPDYKSYEVDSELLCHAIATQGVENVVPTLRGAWSLVWWDAKQKTLNILRNSERPLHMAVHEKDKFIAIASEPEMMDWILKRSGMWTHTLECVPEDTLFSFSLNKIDPTSRELKGKPASKKSVAYYEEVFNSPSDACSTSCDAVSDKDIVEKPPIVVQSTGDWTRGKTGSVAALPAPKKVPSGGGGKASWRGAEFLHDICKGDFVSCRIVDFDLVDSKDKEFYQIRCSMDDYPDIDFRCNVRGEDLVLRLYEAGYGLRAKVFSIMKSDQSPAVNPHRIYLHNPEPTEIFLPRSKEPVPQPTQKE